MRADFTVKADDWILAVWWAELTSVFDEVSARQWFAHVRSIGRNVWRGECAWREHGTTAWSVAGDIFTDLADAERFVFEVQKVVADGRIVFSNGGWYVHGGATRMRQLTENPFPFPQPWPKWLSLRIIEHREAGPL